LRETIVADNYRLRQLPVVVGTLVLPAVAIGLPLVISLLQAGTPPNGQPIPDPMTFTIYDVFTESLPFIAAALVIGIASPAAGALLVLAYAIGNLAVTLVSGELEAPLEATFGRLVSYGLLWLVAVEIPLLGRLAVEWTVGDERASVGRRWAGLGVGSAVIAVSTFAWAQAAPMLITIVYWTTAAWGGPFLAAVQPLQENGILLSAVAGVAGVLLLGVRYLGPWVVFCPPSGPTLIARLPGGLRMAHLLTAAVAVALVSGVISQPIDAVVLMLALLVSRPLGRIVLKTTRLATPLGQIPPPVRLLLGFGAAIVVNWILLSVIGPGDWSRFSTAVVALAVGVVVIGVLLAADDVIEEAIARTPRAGAVVTGTIGGVLTILLIVIAFPGVALADNCADYNDCWTDTLKAALAMAGAAVFAAQWAVLRYQNLQAYVPPSYPQGDLWSPPAYPTRPLPAPPPWYGGTLGGYTPTGSKPGGGLKR
jgi:hypothetical protein